MLVSHQHRFIYTKTMKTASTSVEIYFEPYCVDEPLTPVDEREEYICQAGIIGTRAAHRPTGCKWWHHMPAALIKRRLGDDIWNSYFKFCVIRNPYDKVIAMFYFARDQEWIRPDKTLPDREQFANWLIHAQLISDRDVYCIDGKFCLDEVVRFEQLAHDMEIVCQRISVPWKPEALARFKTSSRPADTRIAHMYTDRLADLVRSRFDFEFEFFNYPRKLEQYPPDSAYP